MAPRTQRAAGGKSAPVRDNSRTACSGSPLGHRFSAPALALALLASSALASSLRAQSATEYQVKAVFLYNFAKFVEWPSDPGGSSGPISICVLGDDPFDGILDQAIKGKTVNGRELVIKRFKQVGEAAACQIVFISSSNKKVLRPILESLIRAGALTVGETEGFSKKHIGRFELRIKIDRLQKRAHRIRGFAAHEFRRAQSQVDARRLRKAILRFAKNVR